MENVIRLLSLVQQADKAGNVHFNKKNNRVAAAAEHNDSAHTVKNKLD